MDMFEDKIPTAPTPIERIVEALRRMGAGFEQANVGEAGLRRLGLEALQRDRQVDMVVRQTTIPDYPEDMSA